MRHAIGVDIGGTRIRAATVSEEGLILAREAIATPQSPQEVFAAVSDLIASLGDGEIEDVGVGIPGRVDSSAGTIFSGGFVDLSREDMVARLSLAHRCSVVVDNDASMALRAEARIGTARGLGDVVMLTIGTGIGGAVMIGGKILHGRATAGQLGHITVDMNGLPCLCGRRGCVETVSSGTALSRHLGEAGLDPGTSVASLLHTDDITLKSVLKDWASPLRAAIDSLVATLDPERVVLGGGLGAAACQALARFPAISPWYQCDVVAARLGDDAGVIGAALAGLEHHR